ncbi:MAG: 1,4-dihydroxy-2-naphthoate polyprenyltransferase [Microthrixaceae bacterium]
MTTNAGSSNRTPNRWVVGARPRTLPAAIAPVLVGTAVGVWTSVSAENRFQLIAWRFACALVVALAVQVATNYANDYSDGTRGTDDPGTRVGPPRLVGDGLATPDEVKRAMLIAFGITLLAGLPLLIWVDWRLALVGVASVAAGWFYTGGPNPYGYAGLGEVFVFVFFGLVATVFSAYVQSEQITLLALLCGAAMGLLATALLVVNNLRDIPGDTVVGKRTLAVRLGARRTRLLYAACLVGPFVLLPFIAGPSGRLGGAAAFLALPLANVAAMNVFRGAEGPALIPVLAKTGQVQLIFGVLLAAGLAVGPV